MTTANHTEIAYATSFSTNATETMPNAETTSAHVYDPCPHFWAQYCFSFGLNRFTFEFGIVALLSMLQLSMVVLVVVRCRQDMSFRQAFYAQFVAVTLVDCFRMIMVRRQFFNRATFNFGKFI